MYKILIAFILLFPPLVSLAGGVPRPIGNESRIKIINYTPNTVFKFIGHYEFQSIIEFSTDEEIDTISMGTPTPWQIVPAGNRIFIKPVEANATTNMTVITNKRMYFFEMHAEEAKSVQDEDLNFVVKFVYPDQFSGFNLSTPGAAQSTKILGPDLSKPEKYNFKYSISTDNPDYEPNQVFDDGEFTYFKFKDINSELPAIFLVSKEGKESLVNFRVDNGYVVIERVADRFTLRHGDDVVCVFNETGRFSKEKTKKNFLLF
jgi:type IV secretion system protein VirB9